MVTLRAAGALRQAQGTLSQSNGGCVRIAVRARPKASRNAVVGIVGDRLKVAVAAAPAGGKANAAIEKTLAKALGVRPSAVAIVAGKTSRDKTAEVTGLSLQEARARLDALLAGQESVERKT
jgi:uncharacterized protein (TIGR00251 family)